MPIQTRQHQSTKKKGHQKAHEVQDNPGQAVGKKVENSGLTKFLLFLKHWTLDLVLAIPAKILYSIRYNKEERQAMANKAADLAMKRMFEGKKESAGTATLRREIMQDNKLTQEQKIQKLADLCHKSGETLYCNLKDGSALRFSVNGKSVYIAMSLPPKPGQDGQKYYFFEEASGKIDYNGNGIFFNGWATAKEYSDIIRLVENDEHALDNIHPNLDPCAKVFNENSFASSRENLTEEDLAKAQQAEMGMAQNNGKTLEVNEKGQMAYQGEDEKTSGSAPANEAKPEKSEEKAEMSAVDLQNAQQAAERKEYVAREYEAVLASVQTMCNQMERKIPAGADVAYYAQGVMASVDKIKDKIDALSEDVPDIKAAEVVQQFYEAAQHFPERLKEEYGWSNAQEAPEQESPNNDIQAEPSELFDEGEPDKGMSLEDQMRQALRESEQDGITNVSQKSYTTALEKKADRVLNISQGQTTGKTNRSKGMEI
jgi:hypothetical protein